MQIVYCAISACSLPVVATVGADVSALPAVLTAAAVVSKGVVNSGVGLLNELICDSVLVSVAGNAGATVGLLSVTQRRR